MGNQAALDTLRAHCAAHPVCSTRFGQNFGPNLALFSFQLTSTYPGNIASLCLESFLCDVVCNKSVAIINLDLGVQQLLIQTNSVNPCASNEQFILNQAGDGGHCRCLADKTCKNHGNQTTNGLLILVIIFLAFIFVAFIGLSLYHAVKKRHTFTPPSALPTSKILTSTSPWPSSSGYNWRNQQQQKKTTQGPRGPGVMKH